MAPWYPGATPTGFLGLRWVSKDNRDSVYTCLNNINNAKFRTFEEYGELVGHDNFNYIVSTWTHKFTDSGSIHTNTEAYYMWQFDAHVGGTSSAAPVDNFGGGGLGAAIPGDAACLRRAQLHRVPALEEGLHLRPQRSTGRTRRANGPGSRTPTRATRSASATTSTTLCQVRPEFGYYRGYYQPAFDDGNKMGEWIVGFDTTLRF